MARYVYDFDDTAAAGRELLGGKGAGLAEMTQIGVPVPAGFTITTDACRAYMARGQATAGRARGRRSPSTSRDSRSAPASASATPTDPLLVSVRSGAAVSMPGMMDTILNLGLSDAATEGLARKTGNERFAYDSYRRLIQMYGEVVDGIDAHEFEQRLTDLQVTRRASSRTPISTPTTCKTLVDVFKVDLRGGRPAARSRRTRASS